MLISFKKVIPYTKGKSRLNFKLQLIGDNSLLSTCFLCLIQDELKSYRQISGKEDRSLHVNSSMMQYRLGLDREFGHGLGLLLKCWYRYQSCVSIANDFCSVLVPYSCQDLIKAELLQRLQGKNHSLPLWTSVATGFPLLGLVTPMSAFVFTSPSLYIISLASVFQGHM